MKGRSQGSVEGALPAHDELLYPNSWDDSFLTGFRDHRTEKEVVLSFKRSHGNSKGWDRGRLRGKLSKLTTGNVWWLWGRGAGDNVVLRVECVATAGGVNEKCGGCPLTWRVISCEFGGNWGHWRRVNCFLVMRGLRIFPSSWGLALANPTSFFPYNFSKCFDQRETLISEFAID